MKKSPDSLGSKLFRTIEPAIPAVAILVLVATIAALGCASCGQTTSPVAIVAEPLVVATPSSMDDEGDAVEELTPSACLCSHRNPAPSCAPGGLR